MYFAVSRAIRVIYIYIYNVIYIYIYIYIRRPQPSAGGARPRKSGFAAPFLLVSESDVRQ